jgi:hypothetical protein
LFGFFGEVLSRIELDENDEVEDDEGRRWMGNVALKVTLSGLVVMDIVDTAFWSVCETTFQEAGRKEFRAGGEAVGADGGMLNVTGRGRIDIKLWEILFSR